MDTQPRNKQEPPPVALSIFQSALASPEIFDLVTPNPICGHEQILGMQIGLGSISHRSHTHPDLNQTVLDVAIFRQVGCGCISRFRTNHPIHRIASPKLRIELAAEFAIMPCASFFWLRLTVKAIHEGSP
jgi:hypothetical protein